MSKDIINICSIFNSIDGEVNGTGGAGGFTTFIRFGGCNLRCKDCDTKYAFETYKSMSIPQIVQEVKAIALNRRITITGGEPLMQPTGLYRLMEELVKPVAYSISIETNGSYNIKGLVEKGVQKSIVLDIKTPASRMNTAMIYDNLTHLSTNDWVKFVIYDEEDFDWVWAFILKHEGYFSFPFNIALSPAHNIVAPKDLVKWLQRGAFQTPPSSYLLDILDRTKVQIQLHKYIWPELANSSVEV